MLTQRHVLVLNAGESTMLECSFKSPRYNMFDYPVIWRKQQLNEWTQINVMGSVNEPFVSSNNRFELSFTATPPYYLIQLSVLGLQAPRMYISILNQSDLIQDLQVGKYILVVKPLAADKSCFVDGSCRRRTMCLNITTSVLCYTRSRNRLEKSAP